MKKSSLKAKMAFIVASVAFILPMAGCSSDEPTLTPSEPSSVKSDIRSVEDACNIAIAFLSADSDAPQSRSISDIENVKVGYSNNSRNSVDTLFYSVNLSDDGGFVLVSAPKAAEPVLAYVEAGSYDPAETSNNPGFNLFIEKSMAYTTYASAFGSSLPLEPIPIDKPYTIVRKADPKLQVEWGQSYPEGLYCSNGLSGCVQTAMAQILSYFEEPSSIELTYPGHDIGRVELNWSEIKKHRTSCNNDFFSLREHLENCEATDESHKALAYLCRELGHRNNAQYLTWEKDGALGTSASSEVANSLYKILLPSRNVMGYKPFNYTCFNNLILNMVSAKAVAHFRGSNYSGGGHAWVCEGGRHYEYHTACYFTNGEEDVRNTYYFYFNWGLDGDFNGYFLGDVYDPSQAISEEDLPPIPNDLLPFKPINRSGYSKDVYYYMIY